METIFPDATGYAGFFAVGFRKDPLSPTETQRVGTVMLKRTYSVQPDFNPALGTLTPAEEPLPVFDQDQPDMPEQSGNLVENGDFEGEDISMWHPQSGVTVARVAEPGGSGEFMLRVTGDANETVTQTLSMPEPLAGHKFSLTFAAKADAGANATVELRAGATTLCTVNAALTTSLAWFEAAGRWPDATGASDVDVVLRTASTAGRTVFYDDVSVFSMTRFEHDLAPFKPEGDVAVLDFLDVTGVTRFQVRQPGQLWQTWLQRTVSGSDFDMFGWASRSKDGAGSRKEDAGTFPDDPNVYPLADPLPSDFNNRFYNGYDRAARAAGDFTALPYFSPGDQVRVRRPGPSNDYGFTLGNEAVTARFYYYRGTGSDEERFWRSQSVTLHLDTLVIEPESDRCYAVWRGVWDFDGYADDVYRRLVVEVDE